MSALYFHNILALIFPSLNPSSVQLVLQQLLNFGKNCIMVNTVFHFVGIFFQTTNSVAGHLWCCTSSFQCCRNTHQTL